MPEQLPLFSEDETPKSEAPKDEPAPDEVAPDEVPYTTFELSFGDEAPVSLTVPGGHFESIRDDDLRTAFSLRAALKDMEKPANAAYVSAIEKALKSQKGDFEHYVALGGTLPALTTAYVAAVDRAKETGDPAPFTETSILRWEDGELKERIAPEDLRDEWIDDPPDAVRSLARTIIEDEAWTEHAKWIGAHALTWAARELSREMERPLPEDFGKRLRRHVFDGPYIGEAIHRWAAELAETARESLSEALEDVSGDDLDRIPMAIERFLGLHDGEDEAGSVDLPVKPNPSPNPFKPATGLASIPSDPFTLANVRGLMKANGTPATVREGEWREDTLGRPVFQYRLSGPPWSGMGMLSLIEDVETHQAWKMLEDGDLDAVTLYFLYLAYASDTSRRGGIDKPFRIDKRTVFHALGLHRRTDLSVKEKVQKVMKLNAYLRSFQIQLTRVSYAGDKVRTDAISPALLWDTYVRGIREDDLFGEPQWGNFWISGREGAWAHEFLHSEHGGRQWTALPLHALEEIDRRSEWPRRILFHSLLMFRINKGVFTRTAKELLRWCRCDASTLGRRKTKGRRKKKLLNALDELKQHGFRIEDSWLRIKGRPFDEWLSYKAKIHPPEDMGKMKYLSGGRGAITAPREDVWTGGQIRALRKHIGDNQTDFADRFDVSQPTVSLWENGHEHPTAEHEATLDSMAESVGFAD